jgi:uncharacterized protein YeaO (DUF488 family)
MDDQSETTCGVFQSRQWFVVGSQVTSLNKDRRMVNIVIKRVYDPPARRDGKRILVDRLWPRGLRKVDAALDDWWKDLAPSPNLRTWFGHEPERFPEFKRRYTTELKANRQLKVLGDTLGSGTVTLLYAAKDPEINHATVLAAVLRRLTR